MAVLVLSVTIPVFSMSEIFAQEEGYTWTEQDKAHLDMVYQHCLDNVDRILTGGNPVQDLINARLIPDIPFGTLDCKGIQTLKEWFSHEEEFNDFETAERALK